MGLWKKQRHPPTVASEKTGVLGVLAAEGVEVVLFMPRCKAGEPCDEALMLEGGRIPIRLADPTPLPSCSNREGCDCKYEQYHGEPNTVA
jgi:hypothetical protein